MARNELFYEMMLKYNKLQCIEDLFVDSNDEYYFNITVSIDGVNETSPCIKFNTTAIEIEEQVLNSLSVIVAGGTVVTESEGSQGIPPPGNPHVYTLFFSGQNILGNVYNVSILIVVQVVRQD